MFDAALESPFLQLSSDGTSKGVQKNSVGMALHCMYIVSSLPGEWPPALHVCCVVAVVRCGVLCCWWRCHDHPHVRGGVGGVGWSFRMDAWQACLQGTGTCTGEVQVLLCTHSFWATVKQ